MQMQISIVNFQAILIQWKDKPETCQKTIRRRNSIHERTQERPRHPAEGKIFHIIEVDSMQVEVEQRSKKKVIASDAHIFFFFLILFHSSLYKFFSFILISHVCWFVVLAFAPHDIEQLVSLSRLFLILPRCVFCVVFYVLEHHLDALRAFMEEENWMNMSDICLSWVSLLLASFYRKMITTSHNWPGILLESTRYGSLWKEKLTRTSRWCVEKHHDTFISNNVASDLLKHH